MIPIVEKAGMAVLRRMDPEKAHRMAIRALGAGLGPRRGPVRSPALVTDLAGLELPNPLGLAAGFDKNAEAAGALLMAGFGFVEVGAVTPRPQPGNPRPRLFRLPEDRGVINRFGFNNDGMDAVAARLEAPRPAGVLGINIGANKDSEDRAADFARVLTRLGPLVDFATVNVSSPNTEKLRDLQGEAALRALLEGVMTARAGLARRIPVFLKIAPDLGDDELAAIAATARASGIDAIIATNTTLSREGLASPFRDEAGGLSGAPLRSRAAEVLRSLYHLTGGAIPLVGVGGIDSGAEAYARIRAGATALQLYSALAYEGLGLVPRILADLEALLKRDGFRSVAAAVGADHRPAGTAPSSAG